MRQRRRVPSVRLPPEQLRRVQRRRPCVFVSRAAIPSLPCSPSRQPLHNLSHRSSVHSTRACIFFFHPPFPTRRFLFSKHAFFCRCFIGGFTTVLSTAFCFLFFFLLVLVVLWHLDNIPCNSCSPPSYTIHFTAHSDIFFPHPSLFSL